ncbi:MAG: DUF6259 domain-containing protein [Bryobacterales bacterium]|nr:DUF6259 domain-containing protein [Bryobacterales bacterium]
MSPRTFTSYLWAAACMLGIAGPVRGQQGTWPGEYRVERRDAAGTLALSTPYYTFRHDLKRGAEISVVAYTHGSSTNLLVKPIDAYVATAEGESFHSQNDASPEVVLDSSGKARVVRVTSRLLSAKGKDSGIRLRTRYEYRWGYVKVRREFVFGESPIAIRRVSVLSAVFDPSLEQYGYRQGIADQEGVSPVSFGVMQWRKQRAGAYFDPPLQTRFVPRYLVLANPGIEGIEWFVSDDLAQWDYQAAGKPGAGSCGVSSSITPLGVSVSINPLDITGRVPARGTWTFDSYLGVPILEGHANPAWLHTSFGARGGKWVTEEQVKEWADSGIRTVHCHNDGDALGDGLFWRDGSYPPYPPEDMKQYDLTIGRCHAHGIRVATYFSNKELHPATRDFKEHGEEWGRKPDDTGKLHHNLTRHGEYGAQMCLKSGWLKTLERNIDTVLKNHNLDGIYYDWNVALYCNNPLHVGKSTNGVSGRTETLALSPTGHWDMDELLELMEWTRERVGPKGLVIVHNTMAPMFATENFADRVVGMEWGYGKLSRSVPPVEELPVEWSFAGARSRGVIGYGSIDQGAPEHLRRVFAVETLLTGVAPWPASEEAIALYKILAPLGDLTRYQFQDRRNRAVKVDAADCITAVYSREGEAWILLGNTSSEARQARVKISPGNLPVPLRSLGSVQQMEGGVTASLDASRVAGEGETVRIPAAGVVLLRIAR